MRQVFRLELSPWLTTPNEEHEVEEDALGSRDTRKRFITPVCTPEMRAKCSVILKYPLLQQIRLDNLKFVHVHTISAALSS